MVTGFLVIYWLEILTANTEDGLVNDHKKLYFCKCIMKQET